MKLTLSHDQSTALSAAISRLGKHTLLRMHSHGPDGWAPPLSALNGIDPLDMAAALVNGWETEKSPVDLLREEFDWHSKRCGIYSDSTWWCRGVREALEVTGQTIEGINA
ncbi:hypothetical protein MH117_10000 [Paenibacillus sp. ACRRX]|uniref:hypothetical protein n=1 Tax=Paenibacillus sp. ACRRX TaxID=2918206 RepID=UPI001EF58D9C|nr:hypothetical protein [Paenibacillus sp. ACRRX]MCG7407756.1 hypothetical protein [Paenibacillus sp. ACRRX]